ncbi:MAG TPA: hypothetical protein VN085_07335, partial [Vicinamibacterales bacterium]|nr:hypothetical protein [Vicinamibacterales bacterium]
MSESIVERLALIEPDWADVTRRSHSLRMQTLRRQVLLTVGALLAVAVLAGGAYAAARAIWGGHDMTPADINRQATVVTSECDGQGRCTPVTPSHKEVNIVPSMGVVFVLPDGDSTSLIPAERIWNIPAAGGPFAMHGQPLRDDSGNTWGTAHVLGDSAKWVGGVWSVPLPDGGTRTITWHVRTGTVRITDRRGGATTTTHLQTGDVVPLVPGTLANDPRTLDKAVSFDLPTEAFARVIIFPKLNETYINFVHGPPVSEPLPYGAAAKYGLTPIGQHNGRLPVTASGGTWTTHLPDGLTRTISWHAGDSFVTVEDTTAKGSTTT